MLDYPKGGTEALVDALVRGVEGKGGKVMLGAHVEQVVVEDGKACGVRLRGGKVIRASRCAGTRLWRRVGIQRQQYS